VIAARNAEKYIRARGGMEQVARSRAPAAGTAALVGLPLPALRTTLKKMLDIIKR